jgi:hypothetical protein
MTNRSEAALREEATNPLTPPERLADLSHENPMLCSEIAKNPSCSQALLNTLSIQYPNEVLNNPCLALVALENGNRYSLFPLKSLISLSLICDPSEHPDLIQELKSRISEGLDVFRQQDYASMTCIWLNRGSHVLMPSDCANAIEHPIHVRAEFRAYIESDGPVIVSAPDLSCPKTKTDELLELLRRFLADLGEGNLSNYIDTDELIREHHGDGEFAVEVDELPDGVHLESNTLYRTMGDDEDECCVDNLLVEFGYCFSGVDAYFENGYLIIPVDWEDEIEVEFSIQMGELDSLVGLNAESYFPSDWSERVAGLLFPMAAE